MKERKVEHETIREGKMKPRQRVQASKIERKKRGEVLLDRKVKKSWREGVSVEGGRGIGRG